MSPNIQKAGPAWPVPVENTAPGLARAVPRGAEAGSALLMGFAIALIVNYMGRPFEKVLVGLHIPAVICFSAIPAAYFLGFSGLKTRVGIAASAFIFWVGVCVPFSDWPGGSAEYFRGLLLYRLVLFLAIASGPRSMKDVKRLVLVTASACIFHLVAGRAFTGSARLGASGSFGNPDDVALMAGMALPLWAFATWQIQNVALRIPLLTLGAAYLLRTVGLSGTRAGVLGLLCIVIVLFLRSSLSRKIAIFAASVALGAVFIITLPAAIRERLSTIVASFDAETVAALQGQSEAMASTAERRELMADAIRATKDSPIVGVGPGQYGEYRWSNFRTLYGRRKRWFPSHNTYLQISSESGIPGLIFYVAFLAAIHRTIRNIRKISGPGSHPEWRTNQKLASVLELVLAYFAFCAFFMTCDLHFHQYILAGLAVALERVTRREIGLAQSAPAAPAPWTPKAAVATAGRLL